MLSGLQIDIWYVIVSLSTEKCSSLLLSNRNEPDLGQFWPRSLDQYYQAYKYAFNKYRAAFPVSSGVKLAGPTFSVAPDSNNPLWTQWASYMKANPGVQPDVIDYHQLDGRDAQYDDPFQSRLNLDGILKTYALPAKPVQVNG